MKSPAERRFVNLQINHFQVSSLSSQRGKSVDPRSKSPAAQKHMKMTRTPSLRNRMTLTTYLPEPARIRTSFAPALNPDRSRGKFSSLSLSRPNDVLGCSFADVIKSERVPSESKGALIRREIIPRGGRVYADCGGRKRRASWVQLATWR